MGGWLDDDVALITGGGSGIGRALVERFVAEGASVVVLDRSPVRVDQLVGAFDGEVLGVSGDVTAFEDDQRAVQLAVNTFGKLDVSVGNAGLFDYFASISDTPPDELARAFDELFGVNVKGYLLGVKAALPHLVESRGCVLLSASMGSFSAGTGGTGYIASKHAVVGLIHQLAFELWPVRVNGVAPGGTFTDLRGTSALGEQDRSFAPMLAAHSPLPSDETTPPVMKMTLVGLLAIT